MALPVVTYGSHTCEDTAITRNHLAALGVPYVEHDYEDDAFVAERIKKYNHGELRTLTVVIGNDESVLTEPSLAQLESAVRQAGYTFGPPRGVQFDPALANRPAPDFKLPAAREMPLELAQLRGSSRAVVFFGHDHRCLICRGFAKQLGAEHERFEEAEARLLIVLRDNLEEAHVWAEDLPAAQVLADSDGAVKRAYVDYFSVLHGDEKGTFLFVLDKYTAPRVGSFALDACGLISPDEVGRWLQLLDYECDE